jgi:6-bladed beta-propeller
MMKNYFLTYGLSLFFLFFSACKEQKNSKDSLVSIDIEGNIDKMEIVNLSQFTDNLRYIPLENIENFPLKYVYKIEISDNLILVSDII